jgi:hypothetical protein
MKKEEAAVQPLQEGWVIMSHPNLEDSYTAVTQEAFDAVWKEKGWQVDAGRKAAPAAGGEK